MADLPSKPAYRIYGLTLESEFPFRFNLQLSPDKPDLCFSYCGVAAESDPPGKELYRGDRLGLFRDGGLETVVFPGIAAFECAGEEIRARAFAEGLEYLVEICLVGNVLAYRLERSGLCAVHASAVTVEGRAAAFIAGTSRGKTTTACSFLAAGHSLVTDDILPVETTPEGIIARPGFPQMKLLPEQLALLGGVPDRFEKVHPLFPKLRIPIGGGIGRFHDSTLALGRIYLLDRIDNRGRPEILPVPRDEALMELLRHAFAAELLDAADRGPGRLERLAAIARQVPMRRLRVPDGYGRLGEARLLVMKDMRDPAV